MLKRYTGRHAAKSKSPSYKLVGLGLLSTIVLCLALAFLPYRDVGFTFDNGASLDEIPEELSSEPEGEQEAPSFTAFEVEGNDSPQINLLEKDTYSLIVKHDVPALLQYPELPTGCESLALTNVLLYYGFDLEKTTIADEWLELSETDFVNAFLGNPRDPGGNSCMAPALTKAANSYLIDKGSPLRAINVSGISFEEVLSFVGGGYPVIAWNTMDLFDPGIPYLTQIDKGTEYSLYENSHTVVISGYDLAGGLVFVSDSLVGSCSYDLDAFAHCYYRLGSQAIIID